MKFDLDEIEALVRRLNEMRGAMRIIVDGQGYSVQLEGIYWEMSAAHHAELTSLLWSSYLEACRDLKSRVAQMQVEGGKDE